MYVCMCVLVCIYIYAYSVSEYDAEVAAMKSELLEEAERAGMRSVCCDVCMMTYAGV